MLESFWNSRTQELSNSRTQQLNFFQRRGDIGGHKIKTNLQQLYWISVGILILLLLQPPEDPPRSILGPPNKHFMGTLKTQKIAISRPKKYFAWGDFWTHPKPSQTPSKLSKELPSQTLSFSKTSQRRGPRTAWVHYGVRMELLLERP